MKKPKTYKSALTEKKQAWQKGLREAIAHLLSTGKSYEQMAVDLQVTKETIELWYAKKRCPKFPTIRYMEDTYGVKIL